MSRYYLEKNRELKDLEEAYGGDEVPVVRPAKGHMWALFLLIRFTVTVYYSHIYIITD